MNRRSTSEDVDIVRIDVERRLHSQSIKVESYFVYEDTIVNIMAGNGYVNLFYFTYDAINAIKKKDLGDYIGKMKGKVVANKQIQVEKVS